MSSAGSRTQKAVKNSTIALVSQLVSLICAFILPRLILTNFGSDCNGITSSITQFIECVVLLRAGIGGVTRAALYKPLAERDWKQINGVVNATQIFMKNVAKIFAIALVVFACIYPFAISDEFDWFYAFSLVLILGISTFMQNYFGITYKILFDADQKGYVYTLISIGSTILNTIVAVLLVNFGFGIHIVKLGSALVFSFNPLVLCFYAKKYYKLDATVPPDTKAIGQRWDAFAQQVASFVTNNTDIIVLTLFSSLKEVSVYSIYYMVVGKLASLVQTLTSGMEAAFGDVLARKEESSLEYNFSLYEHFLFIVSTFTFGCTIFLIRPFVMIYTSGVTDINYSRVVFGVIMSINQFFYCIRLPYQMLVEAAGYFKETRNGAIFESVMNIVISIVLVIKFGLVGVAIGTFCAYCFRTFQYAVFCSKHILHNSILSLIKHILVSALEIGCVAGVLELLTHNNFFVNISGYFEWIQLAIVIAIIFILVILVFSFLFYKKMTIKMIYKIKGIFLR